MNKVNPVLVTCRGLAGECSNRGKAVVKLNLGSEEGIPSPVWPVDSCNDIWLSCRTVTWTGKVL